MAFALVLLAGCANQVTLTPGQGVCTDFDETNPALSTVGWESAESGTARVWRTNALKEQAGLVFDPVIAFTGKVVSVVEVWTGGETDDTFCYEPMVTFDGVTGKHQVRWYLHEGDTVAFDIVEIEAP